MSKLLHIEPQGLVFGYLEEFNFPLGNVVIQWSSIVALEYHSQREREIYG